MPPSRPPWWVALALAATPPAFAAAPVSVEALAQRLQALEQRLGIAAADAGRVAHLEHDAWQLVGSWVLTGEDASYRGVARPNQPFTLGAAGWGALELVARYGELDVDDDAFPLFANPAGAARAAAAWSLCLNWYLTGNLKLVANYTQATFEGGAADGADREDEKTLFTRAQISF